MNKGMIIYKIVSNGKFYIGSTTNKFNKRINQHKYCCNKIGNKKYNLPLYKHIRQNGGFDNVKISIIKTLNITDLKEQKKEEQKIIDELKPSLNTHRAYQNINNKKIYDSLNYSTKKNILCLCCNKFKTKYSYIIHQQTKKYQKYLTTIAPNETNI